MNNWLPATSHCQKMLWWTSLCGCWWTCLRVSPGYIYSGAEVLGHGVRYLNLTKYKKIPSLNGCTSLYSDSAWRVPDPQVLTNTWHFQLSNFCQYVEFKVMSHYCVYLHFSNNKGAWGCLHIFNNNNLPSLPFSPPSYLLSSPRLFLFVFSLLWELTIHILTWLFWFFCWSSLILALLLKPELR